MYAELFLCVTEYSDHFMQIEGEYSIINYYVIYVMVNQCGQVLFLIRAYEERVELKNGGARLFVFIRGWC